MKVVIGKYPPERAHCNDAGLDLRATEDVTIHAGGNAIVNTMLRFKIPEHCFGLVTNRSGLNFKHNIITGTGIIDEGYIGEVKVKLYNLGNELYHVHDGDKVSQIIIIPCAYPDIEPASELEETARGEKGFGSSGM